MKKMWSKLFHLRNAMIILVVSLILTGCFEKKRSVDWYKKNPSARQSMLKQCSADTKKMKEDENCKNAISAQAQASLDRIHKAVGLTS